LRPKLRVNNFAVEFLEAWNLCFQRSVVVIISARRISKRW
jgi:hypothetical protein